MTGKEQIIIDGCNVSGCSYYNPLGNYNCSGCRRCEERPNCYFKQLTRKTQELEQYKASKQASYEALQKQCNELELQNRKLKQECEELKKELNGSEKWRIKAESLNEKLSIEKYHYLKALEEIEGFRKKHCDFWCEGNRILDIINKAKGDNK